MSTEQIRRQIRSVWETLLARLSLADNPVAVSGEKEFFDMVEEARREWHSAITYFNYALDPDLVDHAICAMEAAEKKYIFLLKKAHQEGYRLPARLDVLREGR